MDETIKQIIQQGGLGFLAAVLLYLYLKEKKEHREDLLAIIPLVSYLKDTLIPFVQSRIKR